MFHSRAPRWSHRLFTIASVLFTLFSLVNKLKIKDVESIEIKCFAKKLIALEHRGDFYCHSAGTFRIHTN